MKFKRVKLAKIKERKERYDILIIIIVNIIVWLISLEISKVFYPYNCNLTCLGCSSIWESIKPYIFIYIAIINSIMSVFIVFITIRGYGGYGDIH